MIEVIAFLKAKQGRIRTLNNGGRSSVGRAPDCGSGGRGFEPHRPPQFEQRSKDLEDNGPLAQLAEQ